nr:5'-nucleotidase C-terminal domain-containing protein [Kroppenstedtia pulmonis]
MVTEKRKWIKTVLMVCLCVTLIIMPVITVDAAEGKAEPIKVKLLSINDFHGQLNTVKQVNGEPAGRADYLATYLRERESKNRHTLKVHAGDAVGASAPVSSLLQDEPTIDILNRLHFDVGTVGNHEFDQGTDEMMRLIKGGYHEKTGHFKGARFPYTAANVVNKKTGKPILPPYHIQRIKGIPVGFIGVVTKETPQIVIPEGVKDLQFIDEAKAINEQVKKLKRKGVRGIIVIAHEGGFQDKENGVMEGPIVDIAKKLDDEVDIIVSGHTHSYLNGTVNGKRIVQAHSSGTAFAEVDFTLDRRTRDIHVERSEIITTYHKGVKPDPQIKKVVQRYEKQVEPIINKKVGEAAQTITRTPNEAGESALGNLIADVQRWKMGTDIAFMNPGGIRDDIQQGEVTWGDLYTVQPFGNDLVSMKMTGEQIHKLLNQQWELDRPRILQISGLTYRYDLSRPVGDRIVEIKQADGTPIQPDTAYTVTANAFLSTGGDGFTLFTEATDKVTGPSDLDALVDYVEQTEQPFSAEIEGRIQK